MHIKSIMGSRDGVVIDCMPLHETGSARTAYFVEISLGRPELFLKKNLSDLYLSTLGDQGEYARFNALLFIHDCNPVGGRIRTEALEHAILEMAKSDPACPNPLRKAAAAMLETVAKPSTQVVVADPSDVPAETGSSVGYATRSQTHDAYTQWLRLEKPKSSVERSLYHNNRGGNAFLVWALRKGKNEVVVSCTVGKRRAPNNHDYYIVTVNTASDLVAGNSKQSHFIVRRPSADYYNVLESFHATPGTDYWITEVLLASLVAIRSDNSLDHTIRDVVRSYINEEEAFREHEEVEAAVRGYRSLLENDDSSKRPNPLVLSAHDIKHDEFAKRLFACLHSPENKQFDPVARDTRYFYKYVPHGRECGYAFRSHSFEPGDSGYKPIGQK